MSQKLIKSATVFGAMTLICRILGFVRDMVAANIFGVGPAYDAYVMAFRIPNSMRRFFGEGALQAFVPIMSEYKVTHSHQEARQFVSNVAGNLGLVLLCVSVLGMLGSSFVIKIFAPGFIKDYAKFTMASEMLKITFPYILFVSLTSLTGGLLNTYGRFWAAAITPSLLSVSMIFSSLFLTKYFVIPEKALALAVTTGGIVQLMFLVPFLIKDRLLVCPRICWQDPGVKRVLALMLPAILGATVGYINMLVDAWFASFLPSGSVSWLYYSDRLMEFPLGIFGVGLATVVLPKLSQDHAARSKSSFSVSLDWGLRCGLIIGVPSTLGLYLLAGPLLTTLFQSGRFSHFDVIMSAKSLTAYAIAVVGIMLTKVLASAFYARQDIKTPVRFSIIALGTNIILNSLFIGYFAHAGLALATSLASILHAFLLWRFLIKRGLYQLQAGWSMFLMRLGVASTSLYAVIAMVTPNLQAWLDWDYKIRICCLFSLVALGIFVYVGVLLVSGMRPRDFVAREVK